jgi:hypothetical protein
MSLVTSFAGCLVIAGVILGALALQQRRVDRINAANDEAWANWNALTPDDRAWLLEHGAAKPSLIHWELR